MLSYLKLARILTMALGVQLLVSTSSPADLYVSQSGADANPGTKDSPFRSVQKAVDSAQPGDAIFLGSGHYDETVVSARSGMDGARITIDGQGVASVRKVSLSHSHHTVQNLKVRGNTAKYSAMITLNLGAHYTILSNNFIDVERAPSILGISWVLGTSSPPHDPATASHCLVASNTVTRVLGQVCISVGGQNNLVIGNTISNVYQADTFRLWGRSNVLRGNIARDHFSDDSTGFHMDWIQTFGQNGRGSEDHIIEQNIAFNMPDCQLAQLEPDGVSSIRNWVFRNNLFIGLGMGSSVLIPESKWFHNLFMNCNTNLGGHALNIGPDVDGGAAHGTILKNNIFIDNGDSRSNVGWYNFNKSLTGCVADYNFVAKNGYQAVSTGLISVGLGTHDNFAFFELNGINGGDPGFASPAAMDFSIDESSILRNSGISLSQVTTDFAGSLRPSVPAIGPFEFDTWSETPEPPQAPEAPAPPSGFRMLTQ